MVESKSAKEPQKAQRKVNEFSINIATINGSGSQTANRTLLRAIFTMGIPVSGKNVFPSNIQGLPTWYKIRVSKSGYLDGCWWPISCAGASSGGRADRLPVIRIAR